MERQPFVGLRPFTTEESDVFFGRDREVSVLSNLVEVSPLLIVYAPSGTGKSSLLNAGLLPRVRNQGSLLPVYVANHEADPVHEMRTAIGASDGAGQQLLTVAEDHFARTDARTLLVIDQFEERLKQPGAVDDMWRELALVGNSKTDAISVVISLREDYLGSLEPLMRRVPSLLDSRYRVPPLSKEALWLAAQGPLEIFGLGDSLSTELIETVLADLTETDTGDVRVEPGYFQVVWAHLWDLHERGRPAFESTQVYLEEGRASGIVRQFVDTRIDALLSPFETTTLAAAIRYMVLPTGAKVPLTVDDVAGLLQPSDFAPQDGPVHGDIDALGPERVVRSLFSKLSRTETPLLRRALRGDREEFQLVHDLLGGVLLGWRLRYATSSSPETGDVAADPPAIERPAPEVFAEAVRLTSDLLEDAGRLSAQWGREDPTESPRYAAERADVYERMVLNLQKLQETIPNRFDRVPRPVSAAVRQLSDLSLPVDSDVDAALSALRTTEAYRSPDVAAATSASAQVPLERVIGAARRAEEVVKSPGPWHYYALGHGLTVWRAVRNVLLFLFYLLPAVLGLLLSRYLVGQMYTLPTVTYASIPYTVAAVGAAGLYTAVLLDRLAFDRRITGRPVMSRILAPLLPTRPRTPYLRLGSSMPVPEVKRRIRLTRLIVEWVTLSWPAPLFWPVLISYLSASVVEAVGSSPTAGFHVAAVAAFSISGLIYTLYHEL